MVVVGLVAVEAPEATIRIGATTCLAEGPGAVLDLGSGKETLGSGHHPEGMLMTIASTLWTPPSDRRTFLGMCIW